MKIRILSPAIEDLAHGRIFYEKQSLGLGSYFFTSLFSEIDSLILYAGIHPIRSGHHRLLAKRFPYAIYYKIHRQEILIHRVLDCRRDPQWILNELG